MSFIGDIRHTPAATKPPGTTATKPPGTTTTSADDPLTIPLTNLSAIQIRMDNLHKLLSDSVNANAPLGKPQLDMVSSEISSAIHHIIINAAALLSTNTAAATNPPLPCPKDDTQEKASHDTEAEKNMHLGNGTNSYDHIIELDAVELLAEHVHFCEICGKGFKRDANLRMHMRAHGNQFKTLEALAKPDKGVAAKTTTTTTTRFSCPYVGCNRNRQHKKFRPLKSVICVRNHFKRSHCPKMFSCSRCNKKSFSVVADLRSHLKHCGESKWRCSCGTSFSRKDKLFGHMELFEGHMPAVAVDGVEEEEDTGVGTENRDGIFDGLIDGSDSIENYFFGGDDVFSSPNSSVNALGFGMEGFFNF